MTAAQTALHAGRKAFSIPPALLVGATAMAAAALGMAYFGSHGLLSLLAQAVIVSMLALGVGFLIRVSGLVSFGHAAPFGLGAYAAALALSPGSWLPPEIGLVLIVPTVTFLFFFVGLIASRLEGIAFAMLTLAVGQAIYVAATKFRDVTGGADGLIVELPRRLFGFGTEAIQQPAGMFLLTLALLGCVYALLRLFEFTRYGRLAVAIRENEERVRFLGYRTRALRAGVYAISAGIAALGGILFALYQGFVSPEIVHWTFSGSALIMAILGGTVSLWGPIAGAFVFFFVRDWLSDATTHWLAILGTALIVVTVLWPTGLSGGVYALWDGLAGKGRRGRSR